MDPNQQGNNIDSPSSNITEGGSSSFQPPRSPQFPQNPNPQQGGMSANPQTSPNPQSEYSPQPTQPVFNQDSPQQDFSGQIINTVQPPVQPDPVTQQITPNQTPQPEKPKSRLPKILFAVILILFLFGVAGSAALAYLITYDVYRLPFAPDAQDKLKIAVMSLPFTPKTPEFVVEKALFSHKKIASHDFELSFAFDAPEIGGVLPIAKLDAVFKGDMSYKDPSNISTNLEVDFTKYFSSNLKVKDKIVYFKVNKLPDELTQLYEAYGAGEGLEKYLNKWYFIDAQPLESEARNQLDSTKDDKPITDQIIEKTISFMNDAKVQSAVKFEKSDYEENKVYKLSISADDNLTDYIFEKLTGEKDQNPISYLTKTIEETQSQVLGVDTDIYTQPDVDPEPSKPSDIVKNFYLEAMFDQNSYLLRKSLISFDMVFEEKYIKEIYSMGLFSNPLTDKPVTMRFSLATKFDNFGKDVDVEIPVDATDFDDLTKELLGYSIKEQKEKMNDSYRISNIATIWRSLEMFYSDCMRYPDTLTDLTSETVSYCPSRVKYLNEIPIDPDGSSYYYSIDGAGSEFHLCANLEDPESIDNYLESPNPCPDGKYNFHLSSADMESLYNEGSSSTNSRSDQ